MPLILKGVARQAETVEDMQRVTMKGPMRFGLPFSITVWWASKRFFVEGPPEPAMRPVRGLETSLSLEAGIGDRLGHGEEGEGGAVAHEAELALVDMLGHVDLRACRAPGSGSRARRSRARS